MSDYATVREILNDEILGAQLIEITQHDEEYFKRTGRTFIDLMFNNGHVLRIYRHLEDVDLPFVVVDPDEEGEDQIFREASSS